MIVYLSTVALIISVIFVFYKALLNKETFFKLNRYMLLACLAFAFILPLIHLPAKYSFRDPVTPVGYPVESLKVKAVADPLMPAWVHANKPSTGLQTTSSRPKEQKDYLADLSIGEFLLWIYWIGVAVFAVNFVVQLLTLIYRSYSRPIIQDGRFRIVELSGDQAPCSFANSIFINPEKYEWDTYNQILLHEKVHIEQGHSYDIVFAELALIFQWFNPFAWLYRKAVEDNLEFLTDNELLEHQEVDRSSYQLSLVKVSAPHFPVSLTTNYNQSILKKRLIMMNAKKSNLNTTWKYLFIAPMLLVFVCFLNEPSASAIPNPAASAKINVESANHLMENEGSWFATISNNSINIRFESVNDENEHGSNNNTFLLSDLKNLVRDKEGNFQIVREAGTMFFKGKFSGNQGMGSYKFIQDKSYLEDLSKEGIVLKKEQGKIVFFFIDLKRSYVKMLKKQGYTDLDADKIIPLAALKIDETFINSIKSSGFPNVSLDDLVPLKALNVDAAYIKDIRKSGFKNLSVSKVITFKAQGIDGNFIAHSKESSAPMNAENAKKNAAKAFSDDQEDDAERSKKRQSLDDLDDLSMENLVAMKALNVDQNYIDGFKKVGYKISNGELIGMKALGITPEYVDEIRSAGFKDISSENLIAMKALGVTSAEILQFKKLGYINITTDELVSAKAMGVTPAYITAMKKRGHALSSIEKYVEAKAVGIDQE